MPDQTLKPVAINAIKASLATNIRPVKLAVGLQKVGLTTPTSGLLVDVQRTRASLPLLKPVQLTPTQEAQLKTTPVPPTVIFTVDGARYRPLTTWLIDVAKAAVRCLKHKLVITVPGPADATIALLPTAAAVSAELTYKVDGAVKRRPFTSCRIEARAPSSLDLVLEWDDDAALYKEVASAMNSADSGIQAEISATHAYFVMEPQHVVHVPVPGLDRAAVLKPIGATALHSIAMRTAATVPPPPLSSPPHPVLRPATGRPRPPPDDPDLHPPHPPPPPPLVRRDGAVAQKVTISLHRTYAGNPECFPDLPPPGKQTEWSEFPPRDGNVNTPRVSYRCAGDGTQQFLPTSYRLGFWSEDEDTVRPPVMATTYLDPGGNYRVKVTVTVLPCIEPGLREQLRQHLAGTAEYVDLVLAGPLRGELGSIFRRKGAQAGQDQNLPESIRVIDTDLRPAERLFVSFDMLAADYALFCQLLAGGIVGSITLRTETIDTSVDVHLRLDALTGSVIEVSQDLAAGKCTLNNLLDYPVKLSSAKAVLADIDNLAGRVFSATTIDLLRPEDGRFDARSVKEVTVDALKSESWNRFAFLPGDVTVEAGTPEDWMNRVSRDPGLQAQAFKIHVDLVIADQDRPNLRSIKLELFRDGETIARVEATVAVTAPAADLELRVTLEELLGAGGVPPAFSLEYYSVLGDGSFGLPQRIPVPPGQRNLALQTLYDPPGVEYTIEYDEAGAANQRVVGDRAAISPIIDRLRKAGARWELGARVVAPPKDPHVVIDPPKDPTEPPKDPVGPSVAIITDLLAPAFAAGKLRSVFVVLRPVAESAASTTFKFDADSQATQSWRPGVAGVPPFHFRITYLYDGGVVRQVDDQETGAILVLDPPSIS